MSQDLFAAFGDSPGEQPVQHDSGAQQNDLGSIPPHIEDSKELFSPSPKDLPPAAKSSDNYGDDDWGEFENASAVAAPEHTSQPKDRTVTLESTTKQPNSSPSVFPPKAQKKNGPPQPKPDSKIGKHPFAGHMDFLFEAGEDEYDAGADDLDNLANNPEAAMAYSKRIIAEQEARANQDPISITSQSRISNNWQSKTSIGPSNIPISRPHNKEPEFKVTTRQTSSQVQSTSQSRPTSGQLSVSKKFPKVSNFPPTKDPNVLFDADDLSESEGDDWGDFESGSAKPAVDPPLEFQVPARTSPSLPNVDLLGLGDTSELQGHTEKWTGFSTGTVNAVLSSSALLMSPSSQTSNVVQTDKNPWHDLQEPKSTSRTAKVASYSSPTVAATIDAIQDDGGWGDFDDFETTEPAPTVTQSSTKSTAADTNLPTRAVPTYRLRSSSAARQESVTPPTNVPPPVILLSLFPSLFSSAHDDLFHPLTKLDTTQRHQLLSHPATLQFLRNYLNQAVVLAHLIAGRKLRWKRDQILSQSMRIGPAAAGGKGGMKLTGIDKSELAKEDREVLDVIRLWKAQSGRLRGAVTGAKLPPVPDISEQLPVKTLKVAEGGFVAPHACALCGLKREERVAKVDVDIDDSFEEWWVDGMDMHLTCKNWWEENKRKLQSR